MALNYGRPSENCPTKMRTRWDSRSYGKIEFIVKLHNIKIHECIFKFIFGVPSSIFARIDDEFFIVFPFKFNIYATHSSSFFEYISFI